MTNNILGFDEFLRSLKQNKDSAHSMLLGAGASIESGIPSAMDCIWDWKRDIYISRNPSMATQCKNIKLDSVKNIVQNWLDSQTTYPPLWDAKEYTYYAEAAYRIPSDRKRYFSSIVNGKSPSLGYDIIAFLSKKEMIKSVWTTNFDGLMAKACHQNHITSIEIALDTEKRIYENTLTNHLLCIDLHGDYRCGPIKNTATELDSQSDKLISALKHELCTRNLIVIGYSGRDISLMNALKKAYSISGTGKLYWCGYGNDIPKPVSELLDTARTNNREAYYISTDGFDRTMLNIGQICFEDDSNAILDIAKLKKANSTSIDISSFMRNKSAINKVIKSNWYPLVFPRICLQFDLDFTGIDNVWGYCKGLSVHQIIAVPANGTVYAWGDKNSIITHCGDRLKSKIVDTPLTRDAIIQKTYLKEMLLRTVTIALAKKFKIESDNRNRIWDKKTFKCNISGKNFIAFEGIKLSLKFDWKYTYVTLNPTYIFPKGTLLSKLERKAFADQFFQKVNNDKPNLKYHNYILAWAKFLFSSSPLALKYPEGSPNAFSFKIGINNMLVGLSSKNSPTKLSLPNNISEKQIVLSGIEYDDPQLLFYNPSQNKMTRDFHPMRGLKNNQPYDFHLNNSLFQPTISLGVLCPSSHSSTFESFLNGLNQTYISNYNVDYVIDFPGFSNAFGVSLTVPSSKSNQWIEISPISTGQNLYNDALDFANQITRKIEQLSAQSKCDVILIYIPEEYENLTSYKDDSRYISFDLHDFIKAFAVQKGISTQFIRQKTILSKLDCQIAWSLSLAIYVKSLRTPWTLANVDETTAFAGIGYSINKNEHGTEILVGCSHIYSSDGHGVKYKLSKISEVTYDRKHNPYLSENEAYQFGINIRELFYKSLIDLPKRVVIHKRTPFMPQEIKGITESLSSVGIQNIDLIEITYEEHSKFFEFDKNYLIDGYPVRRGACFPINERTAYLFTHGIAPSVKSQYRKYIKGGKSLPVPLKIIKHYGNGTLDTIAKEILGLSKMNWNSFELYSKLPCTIESSNIIAKIGWLLSQYEGSIYDYRYFM
ncbi:MAG: SIR2 family protein [Oscillospiraceae bacterium]|nr:SIR2 family protein [Oscillospiraceae bacterium]